MSVCQPATLTDLIFFHAWIFHSQSHFRWKPTNNRATESIADDDWCLVGFDRGLVVRCTQQQRTKKTTTTTTWPRSRHSLSARVVKAVTGSFPLHSIWPFMGGAACYTVWLRALSAFNIISFSAWMLNAIPYCSPHRQLFITYYQALVTFPRCPTLNILQSANDDKILFQPFFFSSSKNIFVVVGKHETKRQKWHHHYPWEQNSNDKIQ